MVDIEAYQQLLSSSDSSLYQLPNLLKVSNSGYERRKQTESRCRKSPISSSRLPFDDDVILDILAEGMEHGTYLGVTDFSNHLRSWVVDVEDC